MNELCKMESEKSAEVILKLESNLQSSSDFCDALRTDYQVKRISEILESVYDLGKVVKLTSLSGGFTNQNYSAEFDSGKTFFLRQYVPEKEEKEILYEHALLEHIRKSGFELSTLPVKTLDGKTYFKASLYTKERFFALSEFLDGDNTYNWEYNEVTVEACESAAKTAALFHLAAHDFNPPADWANNEPVMEEQLKYYGSNMRKWTDMIAKNPDNRLFTDYLYSKLDYLDATIEKVLKIYDEGGDKLIKTVIHTDMHPGNFKYKGEEVVALFDFDWPKPDVRLYETAISAMFFSCSWRSEKNGELDKDLLKAFINAYDGALAKENKSLPPMNEVERKFLPEMMMIGSFYPTHYGIDKCANEEGVNIFEWFYYIVHQIRCIEWIDENIEEIRAICIK